MAACAVLAACGGGDGTPTAPGPPSFAGEWSGTTFQGRPISFSVSADQKVTSAAVGYVFGGCSGVDTLSGLNETITNGFTQFGRTLPDGRGIGVSIGFVAERAANGVVVFYGQSSCGSTEGAGPFGASKR